MRRLRAAAGRVARFGAPLAACMAAFVAGAAAEESPPRSDGALRIAMFNTGLARGEPGALAAELRSDAHPEVDAIVEIIQRVDPDVLVLLELDWDREGVALSLFEAELARGRNGLNGVVYPYRLQLPVNTGAPSGFDLDRDGEINGPGDAFGWGVFPGQFGFAILSRAPFERDAVRTFRLLRWAETPFASLRPRMADGAWYYEDAAWAALRLSSKTHVDAPIRLPSGAILHLLVSHPTPPNFDGPEDRNGARNAAEILFWRAYIAGPEADNGWIRDDQGRVGGLVQDAYPGSDYGAFFVIAGDLNADPSDGTGRREAIAALLADPRLRDPEPFSAGGAAAAAAQGGANIGQTGLDALDTGDFRDDQPDTPGNLRVDYLLPSAQLAIFDARVFWPAPDDPLHRLVGDGWPVVSSDHRLIWIDIEAP